MSAWRWASSSCRQWKRCGRICSAICSATCWRWRPRDIYLVAGGGVVLLAALWLLWRPLLAITVSRDIAVAEGRSTALADVAFLVLVAGLVALALKIVGALLIVALLLIPPAAARPLREDARSHGDPGRAHRRAVGAARHGRRLCHAMRRRARPSSWPPPRCLPSSAWLPRCATGGRPHRERHGPAAPAARSRILHPRCAGGGRCAGPPPQAAFHAAAPARAGDHPGQPSADGRL